MLARVSLDHVTWVRSTLGKSFATSQKSWHQACLWDKCANALRPFVPTGCLNFQFARDMILNIIVLSGVTCFQAIATETSIKGVVLENH